IAARLKASRYDQCADDTVAVMQLLVSVANAADASAALAGGADFIDAKDPRMGALGAVSLDVLHEIHSTVGTARPVTAAIGDASDEAAIERGAVEVRSDE